MTLRPKKLISSAYQAAPGAPDRDVAQEAYNEACNLLEKELEDPRAKAVIQNGASIEDIEAVISQLQENYGATGAKRKTVLRWLHKFSEQTMYYGQVLDTLAQHHPEYVSLAWGAVKFVLIGVLNYAELAQHFIRALASIGQILPQIRLNAELYQTDQMQEAIKVLYAYIMRFFVRAVVWYNRSSASRFVHSLIKPFELEYKDIQERIKEATTSMQSLASGASRAELRDVNIEVHAISFGVEEMQQKIDDLELKLDEVLRICIAHKSIGDSIQDRVEDMHPRICDLQRSDILTHLRPECDPADVLRMKLSLTRRRVQKPSFAGFDSGIIHALNAWASGKASALMIVQSAARAETLAKDIAVEAVRCIQAAQRPVLFTFSEVSNGVYLSSTERILKSLIFQMISYNPDTTLPAEQLNTSTFSRKHSETEWLDLLSKLLSNVPECFVVVESEDLYRQADGDPQWIASFMELFRKLVSGVQGSGTRLKVLVVDFGQSQSRGSGTDRNDDTHYAMVRRAAPVPLRLRKSMANPRRRRLVIRL